MVNVRTSVRVFALLAFTLALSSAAQAQTRTWVEGALGDDVNPCSRTAPCRTFTRAHAVVADKGEINVVSPGSYGTVSVTKNVTIDGGPAIAAITNNGTNGVTVNDGGANTIVVTLRNLTINGMGVGTNGVNFLSGKTLNIDHCKITESTAVSTNGAGVRVLLTASGATVNVIDSMIFNNRVGVSATTTVGNVTVNVIRSVITHNTSDGVFLSTGAFGTVRDSKLAFNGGAGVSLNTAAGNSATVLDSEVHHNSIGLFVGSGTTLRLGSSGINQNSTNVTNNGTLVTFCDNRSETNPFPGTVSTNCLQ